MKTTLLAVVVLAFLVLATGCCSSNAGRCCWGSWDWYEPCDLIEGRGQDPCNPCNPCGPRAGQVVQRAVAVPAVDCAPAVIVEETVVETDASSMGSGAE